MADFGVFFVVATGIIFWYIALVVIIGICRKAAGKPDISIVSWIRELAAAIVTERSKLHTYIKVALFALAIRLATLALAFTLLAIRGDAPTILELFQSFVQGDAPHYLNIAEVGYDWTSADGNILLVFFPLYPFLVRLIAYLPISYLAASFIISYTCYCVAMVFLYRLARLDFSAKTAWLAVALISIFPHAFFYGAPYTESLFLLTTTATLYYIRTEKWVLAGIAGAFATATRLAGIFLVIVALAQLFIKYEMFAMVRAAKWKETLRLLATKGSWVFLMFLGFGSYLLINWHISGDPFRFFHYQDTYWSNTTQYFGATMLTQFENVANPLQWGRSTTFVPNILSFTIAIAMLIYAHIKKLNAVYILYTLGYVFISFSPAWLLSGGRYMAACAPLFIFLTHLIDSNKKLRIAVPLASLAGLVYIMGAFITGRAVF